MALHQARAHDTVHEKRNATFHRKARMEVVVGKSQIPFQAVFPLVPIHRLQFPPAAGLRWNLWLTAVLEPGQPASRKRTYVNMHVVSSPFVHANCTQEKCGCVVVVVVELAAGYLYRSTLTHAVRCHRKCPRNRAPTTYPSEWKEAGGVMTDKFGTNLLAPSRL